MDHDHSYKLLFTHPEMVADLLRGFVREDWIKELDFSTLEKIAMLVMTYASATMMSSGVSAGGKRNLTKQTGSMFICCWNFNPR